MANMRKNSRKNMRSNSRKNMRSNSRKNMRKNSRKNMRSNSRKNSRRNNRKQRGGDFNVFNTRFGKPVQEVLDVANGLIGSEVNAAKGLVSSAFDAVGKGVRGVTKGGNGIVTSLSHVIARKNRSRKH